MATRFTAGTNRNPEIRYDLLPPASAQPDLFIKGNAITGFGVTAAPPQLGYWGVAFHDKQVNATTLESGNASTWVMNNIVSPFVPGKQRFVSLGAGLLMQQAVNGKKQQIDGYRALSNRFSPVVNVAGLDQQLTFRDENFDAASATQEWMDNGENGTLRQLVARYSGRDMEALLKTARNRDHFQYLQARELTHAQALQNIEHWEQDSGIAARWSSSFVSAVGNYLLTDPSFVPSLFISPGALNTGGRSLINASRLGQALPSALTRSQNIVRLSAPVLGGQRALNLGRGASVLAKAPAAVHRAFAGHIGHRAALAVELGVYGGAWDAAIQQQRISESEILFDDPAHQQHFSWAELGLVVGLSGSLGFALAGRGGKSLPETRRAAVESVGGNPSSPLGYSFDNYKAQSRMDGSIVRGQRAAAALMGDDFDSVAVYFDDALLSDSGLHRFQVADALEELQFASGSGGLPAVAVHRVMSDMLNEAQAVRGLADDLTAKFGGQMEQAALAEALGRAARELPNEATNTDVLRRAAALVPEELQRQEARLASRAAQARPAGESELAYWQAEARALTEAARRRSLTEAELDFMGTVGGKLESLGEAAPFRGLAQSRSQRYLDGSIFAPFRARKGSKLTQAVQKAGRERRAIQELEGQKGVGDDVRDALRNAKKRLTSAEKAIQREAAKEADRLVTEAGAKVRAVAAKWIANPPTTKGQKFQALDEIAEATDFNQNALLEDGVMIGRLINGWGLRGLRRIAQQGTGMDQTVRSTLGAIREIAHEFDSSKLRVGDIDPTRTAVHRSLEEIRTDMAQRSSALVDEYKRLHDAGKFGTSLRVGRYNQRRREFDKELVLHITGTKPSADADVVSFAALWKRHADEIGVIGLQSGEIRKQLENFFPRRWQVGRILKDPAAFRDALAAHFGRSWADADDLHLDTLASHGHLRRSVNDDGGPTWHRLDGTAVEEGSLTRANLAEFGLDEDAYKRLINTPDETGLTPMQQSANRSKNNLTGDDAFEELPNGKLRRKGHGSPRSERSRELEESVWADEALHPFLDFNFLQGADGYLSSSGFRIMNNARHQQRWGIPGLRMEDTLDWLDARVNRLNSTADADEKQAWNDGIKSLRQKLNFAEGRLPTLRDQTSGLGEWLGDVGTSLAGALYGGGIGQAVLTTEVMQATLSRVYGPTDIVRTVGDIFRVAAKGRDMREQIQTLGLTVRQYRLHSLSRLTGGAIHSGGFQFGLIPKLLNPWLDVFDSSVRALPGRGNRTAAGLRAAAANTMTLGGMDYFTMFSRMLHVQSMLDETGRFFRAAEKTAVALRDGAKGLDEIERVAREAALAGNKTEAAARKAGQRARFKAWTGIARANGFGGNWQVAQRMQRAGLLNPERLAALRKAGEATGSLQDTGTFKTLDFNQLMRYTGNTATEQSLFDESFTALRDMMVDTIHKRVSEQSILQAPTAQTSRTWLGRTQLAMTSFSRSWYDNNILDMAQMPARASVALIGTYLFGETMNSITRDLWRGRTIEDTLADIEADPDNFRARALTRLPLLGAWNSLAMPLADTLTRDGRMQRVDTGESAAEGAIGSVIDMAFDSVHGALYEDVDIKSNTWRTAARFVPGMRSWYATGIAHGLEAAGIPVVDKLPGGAAQGSRRRSGSLRRGEIAPIPPTIQGEIQTGPKFPENLDFLYPSE